MRHELGERLERLLGALLLDKANCGKGGGVGSVIARRCCARRTGGLRPARQRERGRGRTGQDDNDGDGDADGVLGVADEQADAGAAEQQQDEWVLVDLLRELEQDVLVGLDLKLVEAVLLEQRVYGRRRQSSRGRGRCVLRERVLRQGARRQRRQHAPRVQVG